jgi:hypothetical protein
MFVRQMAQVSDFIIRLCLGTERFKLNLFYQVIFAINSGFSNNLFKVGIRKRSVIQVLYLIKMLFLVILIKLHFQWFRFQWFLQSFSKYHKIELTQFNFVRFTSFCRSFFNCFSHLYSIPSLLNAKQKYN